MTDKDWQYTNGEVSRETHPEPGSMGTSMYLCDVCGCALECGETVRIDPHEGVLVCLPCDKLIDTAE